MVRKIICFIITLFLCISIFAFSKVTYNENSKELTNRELLNLTAFCKLFNGIRYGHPSTEASTTDWEKFAVNGVRYIESCKNDDELIKKLNDLFMPIAPTVQIYKTINIPKLPAELTLNIGDEITMMMNYGYEAKDNNPMYYRQYATWKCVNANLPEGLIKPEQTSKINIIPGITVSIPSVLKIKNNRTVPAAKNKFIETTDNSFLYNNNNRSVRISQMIILWGIYNYFYPYVPETGVNFEKELNSFLMKSSLAESNNDYFNIMKEFVSITKDGHGNVYDLSDSYDIKFLPFEIIFIGEKLYVKNVLVSTKTILNPGDEIIWINGLPTNEYILSKKKFISASNDWQFKEKFIYTLVSSKYNSIEFKIRNRDNREFFYKQNYCSSVPIKAAKPAEEIQKGLYYLRIDLINENNEKDIFDSLQNAESIIIDLRYYPSLFYMNLMGHFINEQISTPIFEYPSVYCADISQKIMIPVQFPLNPKKPYIKAKLVFITASTTLSQPECIAQIAKHYKLGTIIGKTTSGTNGDINYINLFSNYKIIFTDLKAKNIDGSQFHGLGISPDISLEYNLDAIIAGKDTFIEKAIEVLK